MPFPSAIACEFPPVFVSGQVDYPSVSSISYHAGLKFEFDTEMAMRLFEGTEFYQPPRCDTCNNLEDECTCPTPEPEQVPPSRQTARIRVEKRKKGKVVTVIRGLAAGNPDRHLTELFTQLKNACGAGGTIQDETIEIQGDHQLRIEQLLKQIGYRVRV